MKDSTHVGSYFASDADEIDDYEDGGHAQTHTGNTDQHEADRVRLSVKKEENVSPQNHKQEMKRSKSRETKVNF